MKHKSTLKRAKHFRRHTRKKLAYGGMDRPLSVAAAPYVPLRQLRVAAAPYVPLSAAAPEYVPFAAASEYIPPTPLDVKAHIFDPNEYFASLKMKKDLGEAGFKEIIENAVAIDCEMVGIGKPDYKGRYKTTLAHVGIVNFGGEKILDTYVIPKEGIDAVTAYFTDISGITKEKLEELLSSRRRAHKHSFDIVLKEVKKKLDGKIIVGHQLDSAFKVLDNYTAPDGMVWDSAILDIYRKNIPWWGRGARKLEELAKTITKNIIQVKGRPHSPIEDAKASMNLYRMYFGYPKIPL